VTERWYAHIHQLRVVDKLEHLYDVFGLSWVLCIGLRSRGNGHTGFLYYGSESRLCLL
jgi:hypothetical protein